MYESKYFPILVANMVNTGERSGRLPETLKVVNEYFDKEVNDTIQNLLVMLEPLLIVIIGIVVGVMAVGMLMPILNMSQMVH